MLFIYIKFVYVLFLLQVTNISATTSYIGYEWLRGDSGTCDAECAAINADCDVTGMNTITTSQSVLDLAAAIGTSWLCAGGTETGVYAPSYVTSTGKCEYLASGETSACNHQVNLQVNQQHQHQLINHQLILHLNLLILLDSQRVNLLVNLLWI